jgi:hypothetical protein
MRGCDSVRGRWRLNHTATIGDDYGYFSGFLEPGRVVLQLRPTQPTPCTGLQLEVPVGGENGSTMGAGELTGDGSCFVPSTIVILRGDRSQRSASTESWLNPGRERLPATATRKLIGPADTPVIQTPGPMDSVLASLEIRPVGEHPAVIEVPTILVPDP